MRKSFKSNVPIEEVCRRYDAGESIGFISQSYGCSEWTICDRLKRGGVKARTNSENAGVSPEKEQELIRDYASGMTAQQVADAHGVGCSAVWGAIKRNGVESHGLSHPTYSVDSGFWSCETREMIYWLGFSIADGNLCDRGKKGLVFSIGLKTSDGRHLEKFKQAVKYNGRILPQGERKMLRVAIYEPRFCKEAIEAGVVPRKSWCAAVPDKYVDNVDFWRGMIDGNGSVGVTAKGTRPIITHSGHKLSKVPQQFKEWAERQGVNPYQSHAGVKKQAWSTSAMGADAVRIARILYANAPEHLRLDRKYEAWCDMERLVHEKAVNCKSFSAVSNYGDLWTPEELEMAEESLRKELAGSHRSKPPSRKGVRLIDGVWAKP